jgi:hypothetical protein
MSRTRTNDRLSEIDERVVAAAEADLSRLLSIEPSPEFAAKVRARISEPQAARGWSAGWLGLALASGAALVIALSGLVGWRGLQTLPLPVDPPVASVGPSLKTAPPPVEPVMHRLKTVPLTAAPLLTEGNRPASPEVLIDPSLAQAIRRLANSSGPIPLEGPQTSPPLISDAPVPSVVVEPLTVPELKLKPADQTSGG